MVRKSIDSSALCCDVYFDSGAEYSGANCEYVDCIERFSAFDVIYTVYSGVQKNIERSIISCKKEFGMRKQIELFFSCDLQCLLEPINDVRCVQCLLDNMQNIRLHFFADRQAEMAYRLKTHLKAGKYMPLLQVVLQSEHPPEYASHLYFFMLKTHLSQHREHNAEMLFIQADRYIHLQSPLVKNG